MIKYYVEIYRNYTEDDMFLTNFHLEQLRRMNEVFELN